VPCRHRRERPPRSPYRGAVARPGRAEHRRPGLPPSRGARRPRRARRGSPPRGFQRPGIARERVRRRRTSADHLHRRDRSARPPARQRDRRRQARWRPRRRLHLVPEPVRREPLGGRRRPPRDRGTAHRERPGVDASAQRALQRVPHPRGPGGARLRHLPPQPGRGPQRLRVPRGLRRGRSRVARRRLRARGAHLRRHGSRAPRRRRPRPHLRRGRRLPRHRGHPRRRRVRRRHAGRRAACGGGRAAGLLRRRDPRRPPRPVPQHGGGAHGPPAAARLRSAGERAV
ncbi:MAG: NADPH:quinone oxidoreductase 2, partial [uncultured Solirubrobacteraceae bacterium]